MPTSYGISTSNSAVEHLRSRINLDAANFNSSIDRILKIICEKVQLSNTQHVLADEHYKAVSNWLEKEDSNLFPYKPQIYPQGSLPMGVTNKPLSKEEYDLDFICELDVSSIQITPADLFNKVEYRLRQHEDYKHRIKLGKRCIRLIYAHDFHLDIVPARTNSSKGYGQVQIPDRELEDWRDTNSRQYVNWFNTAAERLSGTDRIDAAEPLSTPEKFDKKSALKFSVQLLKRHRDIAFRKEQDLAPVSIVLSTLAARAYTGNESVFKTITEVLNTVQTLIDANTGRLQVWNPANLVSEDLGERWDSNAESYERFKAWVSEFQKIWSELEHTQGLRGVADILSCLFGEEISQGAIREDAQRMQDNRRNGLIGIRKGTATLTTKAPMIFAPKNTFYGE